RVDDHCIDVLLRNARTQNGWLPKPVSDEELRAIYDILKVGPTSTNSCPARIIFLRAPEAKARLLPALSPGNVDKTKQAPATAIRARSCRSCPASTSRRPAICCSWGAPGAPHAPHASGRT